MIPDPRLSWRRGAVVWTNARGRVLDVISAGRPPVPSIEAIQTAVSEAFGTDPADMKSARRDREAAVPRQAAMYLARQLTVRSWPEIGRRFGGRDHTTVIHAFRRIERLMAEDAELATKVSGLAAAFGRLDLQAAA